MSNNWKIKQNWIHFTGIGGVTMSQLAQAFFQKGYIITGSDQNIYEPVKSYLLKNKNIKIQKFYKYSNLIYSTYSKNLNDHKVLPKHIIAGGGLSLKNKELLFAKKRSIPIYNFPQILSKEMVIKNNSIVVAGSYGKTTTTALLVDIFKNANINISYMIGAIPSENNQNLKLKNSNTKYSIIEGDEYICSRNDKKSKFFYYNPKFLLLTGFSHDHTDIFKTYKAYINNFKKLVKLIPTHGLLIYNKKNPKLREISKFAKCKTIGYKYNISTFQYQTKVIGNIYKENMLAASILAKNLNISDNIIQKTFKEFNFIKRRLEIIKKGKYNNKKFIIINDFGASPSKAYASIRSIKDEYPNSNIICIFEPNIGNRTKTALKNYRNVFKDLDLLLMKNFKKIKQKNILDIDDFYKFFKKININIKKIKNNNELLKIIKNNFIDQKLNIILFLSSGSIDQTIRTLEKL